MKGTFTRRCAANGCNRSAWTQYARYCGRCRQRRQKHGHPEQIPVRKKTELKKYLKPVKRLLQRGNMEKIEAHLRTVAARIEEAAHSPEAVAAPFGASRWKQKAVDEILRVLGDTDAVESGILVAAVFLLRDQERRRFVDDTAFDFELVRLWRSQTRLNFGSYWNQKTDKVVATYRPLPRGVVKAIAPYLTIAYSRFASYVTTAFKKDLARQTALRTSLDEGFAPLLAD